MTEYEYITGLYDQLTLVQENNPVTVNTTMLAHQGSQIQLAVSPANPETYQGGIIEFTSGDAQGKFFTIAQVQGNIVTINGRFHRSRLPDPGDAVRLSGGPIKDAVIYVGPPTTIAAEVESGKKFFLFIDVPRTDQEFRTLKGSTRLRSKTLKQITFTTQIIAATPDTTGTYGDAASAELAFFEIHKLKEQVLILVENFRHDNKNHMYATSGLGCDFEKIDFPGFYKGGLFKAAIIEFEASVSS